MERDKTGEENNKKSQEKQVSGVVLHKLENRENGMRIGSEENDRMEVGGSKKEREMSLGNEWEK
jgi:hypothetical protein